MQALALALGVQNREPKVKDYYHQMETGQLDPGVPDRLPRPHPRSPATLT